MTSSTELELTQPIKVDSHQSDSQALQLFSQQLFACSLDEDMQALSVDRRSQIALSMWQVFSTKSDNEDLVVIEVLPPESGIVKGTALKIITDDKAFIVDSLSELLMAEDHKINLFIHPVLTNTQGGAESILYIELAHQLNSSEISSLTSKLQQLLTAINKVTSDWQLMISEAKLLVDETTKKNVSEFLLWLSQDNFVFLGHQVFSFNGDVSQESIEKSSGLFSLNDSNKIVNHSELNLVADELTSFIDSDTCLFITKSSLKSVIHRNDYYDQVHVKQFSKQGQLIAIHRFIGLFTQKANNLNPNNNPHLKEKLDKVLDELSLQVDSHNYRNFSHILAALPKKELYESSKEQLLVLAKGIYSLNAKNKAGAFIRENSFNHQVSVLVFVSKEAFCTDLRDDIEHELAKAFEGKILSRRSVLNDNYLAQWHFIVEKGEVLKTKIDTLKLVATIEAKTQSWQENLSSLIYQNWSAGKAHQLVKKYSNGFSKSYREHFCASETINAINCLEQLGEEYPFQFQITSETSALKNRVKLNIYSFSQSIALSDSIPILENFSFRPLDEFSFKIKSDDDLTSKKTTSITDLYSYTLEYPQQCKVNINNIKANIEDALLQVWQGDIENDGYNKLLLSANVNIRQIVIIRAYGKYLRQLGLGYSEEYFQQALIAYPDIVDNLIALFEVRFSLNDQTIEQRTTLGNRIKERLIESLNVVGKIDHDRILRNFISAISATVRTNFYQDSDCGQIKSYCSFKIRSGEIEDAPQPRPFVETFVYSPRVEGVHLRFGLVSRGGLRWSDRREDFRTEVLGLVKAQQVKNVVIVPQGAKGGFVPKQLPMNGSREQVTNEAIACYKVFISALLDLTDNNTEQGISKPKGVVCFDGDDSYLVVAADKGTATFSDIANELSNEYSFWLGDAFASGGSIGYDHKKMGITAKGAWVSVQRHFSEMDIDVQNDEIDVVGIGDMSGDVFGNGMLSSKSIRLVAAFDHRDVFIDPSPYAASSYIERERLYHLPRSSWADYNVKLISKGGGVFSRSLKHIELSKEIKVLLNIDDQVTRMSPVELIRCILTAKADLLWFGGIGTYVKASNEVNNDVGDKANDPLRINGNQLQCRVIGEGGNLGCTQLARIEFSKIGGKLNTDAVDNSAGVNCSDNEVNIKILLNNLVSQNILSQDKRNVLLAQMTEEVGVMVLLNNYYQAQALSIDEANSQSHFDSFSRLTHYLVNHADLDRALEYLPDDEELQARSVAKHGLTRPELAVLMAYSKMDVNNALLKQQDLLTDPYFEKYLLAAFPDTLAKKYPEFIVKHPLAQQIVATSIANEIFNRGGIHAVREQTGASIAEIVKAFIIAKEVFSLDEIWSEIESLSGSGSVSAQIQIKMMVEVQRFYRLMAIWFINHASPQQSIDTIVQQYSPGINTLQQLNDNEITLPFSPVDESLYQLEKETNSLAVVDKIHQLKVSSVVFCDIVKTAFELKLPVTTILPCYCSISKLVGLEWLIEQTEKVDTNDHWSRLARFSLLLDLLEFREKLVVKIIQNHQSERPELAIELWAATKTSDLNRIKRVVEDLKAAGAVHIDKLYFANRQIRSLLA